MDIFWNYLTFKNEHFVELILQVALSIIWISWKPTSDIQYFFLRQVGPSGALFGIIACLLVELVQNWQIIKRPWENVLKLGVLTVLLIVIGCFPWVDNFAHLGGLMFGTLLGFAFLPYITFGKWDRRRKIIQIVVSIGLIIAICIVLCIVFFVDQDTTCAGCHHINCIPFTEDFCSPSLRGRGLDPRILGG